MIANSKVNKAKVNALIWKSEKEFVTTGASVININIIFFY